MQTAIVRQPATGEALSIGDSFDTGILAGGKAPNTIEQYTLHFRRYLEFAGDFQTALQPPMLARWRQTLYEVGYTKANGTPAAYSVNAINQRLAAIRGLMAEAAQQGYISHDRAEQFKAVKGIKQSANRERRNPHARTKISRGDMLRIIESPDAATPAGSMHRAFMETLAGAGLRVSEAVALKQSDIRWDTGDDGKSGWVIDVVGKGKADADACALSTRAYVAICDWVKVRRGLGIDSDYIFTGFTGRGSRGPRETPISRVSGWQMVKRYATACELQHIKPHDFRRYVGTQLAKLDIRLAQKQLRHVRIETTAQYDLSGAPVGATEGLV